MTPALDKQRHYIERLRLRSNSGPPIRSLGDVAKRLHNLAARYERLEADGWVIESYADGLLQIAHPDREHAGSIR